MKKFISFVAVLSLLMACEGTELPIEDKPVDKDISADKDTPVDKDIHVTGVSLDSPSVTVKEEESITLTATITPPDATNQSVTWSTSDPAVVLVNNGIVTGVQAGNATITVTTDDGNLEATCTVKVESNLPPSVTLDADHISAISAVVSGKSNLDSSLDSDIIIGFQYSEMAGLLPSNSEMVSITEVGDDSLFYAQLVNLKPNTHYYYRTYVRQNGLDTFGKTMDFTTKEISSLLQTREATCVSAINAKLSASLDLTDVPYTEKSLGFYMGKTPDDLTDILEVKEGENSFETELTRLESSQEYFFQSFISLDGQELRANVESFATKELSTLIKTLKASDITTEKAQLNAQMNLTDVKRDSIKHGFLIGYTEEEQTTNVLAQNISEDSFYCRLKGFTYNTTYWYKAYLKLDEDFYYGDLIPFTTGYVPVESISLDQNEVTFRYSSEWVRLNATVLPANASNDRVEWSSDNDKVVQVDGVGTIFPVGAGTATVTATTQDQGKTATCIVHVVYAVKSISIEPSFVRSMNVGSEKILEATVLPSFAVDKTLTWKSSDEGVATVDQNGKVRAVSIGKATITATANDGGGASASCNINVDQWVDHISFDENPIVINRWSYDEYVTLDHTIEPADATTKDYEWVSSNPNVVEISWSNHITAKARGNATVTVTAKDGNAATASIDIEVRQLVTNLQFDKTTLSLLEGTSDSISVSVGPDDANDRSVTWTSSDESVAIVDQTGKVTAKSLGSANIVATANDDGHASATCKVTVKGYVTSISMTLNKLSVPIGTTKTLTAYANPRNAYNTTIAWSSSDPSIATVSDNGEVAGVARGKATITAASVMDPTVKATCEVTVTQPVTAITLDKTSLVLLEGKSEKINATVLPDDADEKYIEWTSSDKSVATVDRNGNVTAVSKGSATIMASSTDGSKIVATCEVTVRRRVSNITLSQESLSLYPEQSVILTATVSPNDAYDPSITWESNSPSIVTVTDDGKVTAVAGGTAVILVTANDGGGAKAMCNVKVKRRLESISLTSQSLALCPGDSHTIHVIYEPYNIEEEDKGVTWMSDNPSVAKVDENGTVTALKKGKATITVTSTVNYSVIYSTCSVTVSNPCPAGAVDMGTTNADGDKVYWSASNLGDNGFVGVPSKFGEKYGDLYAWGEITKDADGAYDEAHYRFYNNTSSGYKLTKYCFLGFYGNDGYTDNLDVLELEDDAANCILHGNWRIPTSAEWQSLIDNCTWTWDGDKGGFLITASNGNSIYLPAVPTLDELNTINSPYTSEKLRTYMIDNLTSTYWCSDLAKSNNDPRAAYKFVFNQYSKLAHDTDWRYCGFSIRPVTD